MVARTHWRFALPLLMLGVTLSLMWRSAVNDPGPTGLPNDLPNWHNRPGDLQSNVLLVLGEALLVLVLIRPWSYDRSWGRALSAAVLFVPWTLLNGLVLIHSGGIMVIHTAWLLALCVSLLCGTLVSAGSRMINRAPPSDVHAA